MTTPSPAIGAFWRAFSDALASLQALPLRERVGAANALIDQHLEGLALEMSGDDADAVVDLIVTAHGSIERFPLVAQVVAAAPALLHYRVRAFRERTTQPDFPIGMEGFELSTSEVLVALEQTAGELVLRVTDDGQQTSPGAAPAAGLGVGIMAYRAKLVGGTLRVAGGAEGGMEVVCRVPGLGTGT